jgi:hypothetical protein
VVYTKVNFNMGVWGGAAIPVELGCVGWVIGWAAEPCTQIYLTSFV